MLIDRLSHEVPFYRLHLKAAILGGAYVINDPFWWSADDKFFNYALATKLGVAIPPTVLLPHKEHPTGTTERSMRNLKYPLDWDAVIRTNLSAAFYLINAASAVMREQGKSGRGGSTYDWGRIVNIVSSAGLYGNLGQAAYASAKAGLFGLTRVTAMDMARSLVTCNAVAPFAVTRITHSIKPQNDAQAQYKARALSVSPRHVANFVAFLCSPAAQKISGQVFGVRAREPVRLPARGAGDGADRRASGRPLRRARIAGILSRVGAAMSVSIRYAKRGAAHIAYRVDGDGPDRKSTRLNSSHRT